MCALVLGEGRLRAKLERLVSREGVGDVVSFLGERSDVLSYIAMADLFVFSSVEEGLGTSLLDAMVMGVPTVATRAGGIPDLYGTVGSEWLVPPRDSKKLAEAVVSVLSDPGEAERRVRLGRERAALFSVPKMAEAYEGIYLSLLKDTT